MRPEDLVFWLDRLDDTTADTGGVLCQRHADSMVVPRSWTLDDLRDPDLHLFRPPEATVERQRRRKRHHVDTDQSEQLALGVEVEAVEALKEVKEVKAVEAVDAAQSTDEPAPNGGDDAIDAIDGVVRDDAADDPADAWSPSFDDGDDLDGLLAARSPLLARAFRGDDRPR